MKYLFISSDKYPPYRVDVSELFGKEMVNRGHHIDFVLQSTDTCAKSYEAHWSGCCVFVGPTDNGNSMMAKVKKNVYDIVNDMKFIKLQRCNRYDFLLVKDKFISGLLVALLSKCWKIPFIYWLSFPFPQSNLHLARLPNARFPRLYRLRGHLFRLLLYKFLIPLATHVFVQSELMMKDIEEQGISREKMTAVPMGVSENLLEPKLYSQNLNLGTHPKIVYIGTLVAMRRMDFVIRAFNLVLKKCPNAKLYMVGTSDNIEDIDLIKMTAQQLGISQSIILTGFIERQEALSYVQSADVCISPIFPTPILNLGSPTKIIEYMALKKAVVANNHPEQEQILANSRGGICVPWQEEPFAEAICYLLDHPDEAIEMGRHGQAYVKQNRSYNIIAERVNRKIQHIINQG
jgi:glycosyltransferase involved in cell wall biosynthesis